MRNQIRSTRRQISGSLYEAPTGVFLISLSGEQTSQVTFGISALVKMWKKKGGGESERTEID